MADLNLEKFNPTIAELQGLVAVTKGVTITDFNDKKQFEVVKENRIMLRDARINITKKGKELRDDAIKFQKAVIEKEKELIGIIEPEESRLKEIEDEAKEQKLRAERVAVLPMRKDKLASIGDTEEISDDEILGMDDALFNTYYNERVTRKNEADRLEIARQQEEQRKEAERLEWEKGAQEREAQARQEERERAQREKKEEEERKQEELANQLKRKLNDRTEEVVALGFSKHPDSTIYGKDNFRVTVNEIKTLRDGEWAVKIEKIKTEMARLKEEAEAEEERKRKEAEQKEDARYQKFLSDNGYTEETAHEFYIETLDGGKEVNLFKLVGQFTKDN